MRVARRVQNREIARALGVLSPLPGLVGKGLG